MIFYTTERLGPKRSFTPEGFLLCEEVPIARTGHQDYADWELPDLLSKDSIIRVERSPEEVFSPSALSSFNGKAVTNDHPPELVTPYNWNKYAKGHVQNVRRGERELSDCVVADLLITDPGMMEDIQQGKREVSNGYDAEYEQTEPGKAKQIDIVGNHTALVFQGRAGARCAIGDSKVSKNLRIKTALDKAMELLNKDADGDDKGQDGDNHVHIHMAPDSDTNINGDKKEPTMDKAVNDRFGAIEKTLDGISKVLKTMAVQNRDAKMRDSKRMKDGEGEDPDDAIEGVEEPLEQEIMMDGESDPDDKRDDETMAEYKARKEKESKTQDKRTTKDSRMDTRDSSSMEERFNDTLSRAELLVPGIGIPTFDSRRRAVKSVEMLDELRKRALTVCYATKDGKALIDPLLEDGAKPSFHKLTVDAARVLFVAASNSRKTQKTSGGTGARVTTDENASKGLASIAAQNEFYRKHYARPA